MGCRDTPRWLSCERMVRFKHQFDRQRARVCVCMWTVQVHCVVYEILVMFNQVPRPRMPGQSRY
jgi:hypothetical protein